MGSLVINGQSVGGQVYELKPGQKVADAIKAGAEDHLDEIYFSANNKQYVALAPSLNISESLALSIQTGGSAAPRAELKFDGKASSASLIACDRETQGKYTSLNESVKDWKLSGLKHSGIGAAAVAGGAFGLYHSIALFEGGVGNVIAGGGALNLAKGLGKIGGGTLGATVTGIVALSGAALVYEGLKQIPKANAFKAHEESRLNHQLETAPIQAFLGNQVK